MFGKISRLFFFCAAFQCPGYAGLAYTVFEKEFQFFSDQSGFTGYHDMALWVVKTDYMGYSYTAVPGSIETGRLFSIYPNPASQEFRIHSLADLRNASIVIMNLLGQELRQENVVGNDIGVDLKNLPSGIYMVQITQQGKLLSREKLVVTDLIHI